MLEAKGTDPEEADRRIDAITADPDPPDLPDVERALIAYALKLNDAPATIVREDVEVLRSQGLADRAIHDLAAIVAYFAFVNRIADGLGVELEPPSAEA